MKLHVYITKPDDFAAGDFESCFTLSLRNNWKIKGWIYIGEIDLAINIDPLHVRDVALSAFDARIKEIRATAQKGVEAIEQRKQNLMALEHHV